MNQPELPTDQRIQYFTPQVDHFTALRAMARQCFSDTFAHLYEHQPFEHFLEDAYGERGSMSKDLADSSILWLVAEIDSKIIGYAKLRRLVAPVPDPSPNAMEIQQIYVLRQWQGYGVAEQLMQWALMQAHKLAAPEIYLTVFDHNSRAKRFYTRHGFAEVGSCIFQLGDRIDDDRVWRKRLDLRQS